MPDPDRETQIDQTDARAGSNEGVVRWVLLISLSLAIVALTIIWVTGALTQGAVESEGTTTGRVEETSEDREGLAEEMDLVAPNTEQETRTPSPPARGIAPNAT